MSRITTHLKKRSAKQFTASLIIVALAALSICANLFIVTKKAYGDGLAGSYEIPTPKPCTENCSAGEGYEPYWVYFRIKKLNEKNEYIVGGTKVSGCNGAGGFYFEFNKDLTAGQTTMVNYKHTRMPRINNSTKKTIPTNRYDTNHLEPIYLTFHSDGKDYSSKGEINICSLTSSRKKIND